MAAYDSLARYYDSVFPYDGDKARFVLSALASDGAVCSVLEVGCGSGGLSWDLARRCGRVVGTDIEEEMVALAAQKQEACDRPPEFRAMDMLAIDDAFPSNSFDAVACFGNALVHLSGEDVIADFCGKARGVLNDSGVLMLGILNYEHIFREQIRELPLIENETVTFQRLYDLDEERRRVGFRTILTIKETGQVVESEVTLYPILKDELVSVLHKSGFARVEVFGDYDRQPLREDSFALVFQAR
jgi:SAM-dependent methyltransferase